MCVSVQVFVHGIIVLVLVVVLLVIASVLRVHALVRNISVVATVIIPVCLLLWSAWLLFVCVFLSLFLVLSSV